MLTFTGLSAVILGSWIFIAAYTSPPDVTIAKIKKQAVVRQPSSYVASSSGLPLVDRSDSNVETVSLGCLRHNSHIEMKSTAKQIRLKSELCGGKAAALDSSSIVNRANGFEATLYNLENGGFTSDYISLENGLNQLMFEINDNAGARAVAEISISRDL